MHRVRHALRVERFAHACAEVVAATGIPVLLANAVTPTPALSSGVRERGATGGIMITSSHNPAQWNGVKYKGWYGGSGQPAMISAIESYLGRPAPRSPRTAPVRKWTSCPPTSNHRGFPHLDLISKSGMKFCIDSMYGAGGTILANISPASAWPTTKSAAGPTRSFPASIPSPLSQYPRPRRSHCCQRLPGRPLH